MKVQSASSKFKMDTLKEIKGALHYKNKEGVFCVLTPSRLFQNSEGRFCFDLGAKKVVELTPKAEKMLKEAFQIQEGYLGLCHADVFYPLGKVVKNLSPTKEKPKLKTKNNKIKKSPVKKSKVTSKSIKKK